MAGYSGTPLPKKLGFGPGMRVLLAGAPGHYRALPGKLPPGVRILSRAGREPDLVHVFYRCKSDPERRLGATGQRHGRHASCPAR